MTRPLAPRLVAADTGAARRDTADVHAACVAACVRAGTVCSVSAHACLEEPSVAELRSAIRLALDCSDLCHATASVLGRHSQVVPLALRRLLEACAEACEACAQECELLESLDYCRLCAVECRRCEQACRALLAAM